ncbi:hypothetical protein [Levilactobacillus bambusae]|uniref:Lipoprotein n=1 Tax=Levilactobacillus bambusae TaxID=2024736 RepID=A0A2V1MXU0_9LACO|nr:hypothetical protein [Levilactobacillus bambusae]PWF99651.1 hypothetical protein DCM90_07495 [Levilactobacillus bambusae]
MRRLLGVNLILLMAVMLSGCGNETADDGQAKDEKISSLQRANSQLRAQSGTESTENGTDSTAAVNASSSPTTPVQLSEGQMTAVNNAFYSWAAGRAEVGNMAVTDWTFEHGAGGRGDWYADTPDGKAIMQDEGHPGKTAYPIQAIGGVTFFTAKDGSVGKQDMKDVSTTAGYSTVAREDKPVTKYLLGNNGVVYELKGTPKTVGLTTGYGEAGDDGTFGAYEPQKKFIVSQDTAAQTELNQLLDSYR